MIENSQIGEFSIYVSNVIVFVRRDLNSALKMHPLELNIGVYESSKTVSTNFLLLLRKHTHS